MSTAKVCLQCGAEYDGSTLFCPRDGSALKLVDPGSALIGQVVAERFLVHEELGKGGMGQVFLAEQVRIGRRCALKVIREGLVSDPDAVLRFNREASNAASISHPNVVQVYDFGESRDGLIFLAMEYVDGESLGALLTREGTVAPLRAVSIAAQVASALTAAHDLRIIHRDLKPDNVMLGRNRDGSDLVKVVDFGVARVMDSADQKVTGTGLVIGTPEYMSPEQFTGKTLDGRSDLYSLALILFRMLTGTPAFDAEGAREALDARFSRQPKRLAAANPHVAWPPGLQEVIDRGMALRVDDRYQSAEAFSEALVAVTSYWNPGEGGEGASASGAAVAVSRDSGPAGAQLASRPAPPMPVVAARGGATAAMSSSPPPATPVPAQATPVSGVGGAQATPRAPLDPVADGALSASSNKRGPIMWAMALIAAVAISVFATRGMWGGARGDATGAGVPSRSASTKPEVGGESPASGDSVASSDSAPTEVVAGNPPIAAGGTEQGGSRTSSGAHDSAASRATEGRATEGRATVVTPPAERGGEQGGEGVESAAVRAQLTRLKTLTDSGASAGQAREALLFAGKVHPTTREGRVELKYRTLEANILLDETTAICSLLSQLRFEAKGTRFEEAVAAYGAVAQESCPARND